MLLCTPLGVWGSVGLRMCIYGEWSVTLGGFMLQFFGDFLVRFFGRFLKPGTSGFQKMRLVF
jgi:hypothetical protein